MLRTAGSWSPALFLDAPAGPVFCILQSPDMSEMSKDKMMEACRFLAISTNAAAVLVMESLLVRAKRGVLDTETRPSLNPDREEVVCLLGKTRAALGLANPLRLRWLSLSHLSFLDWHRSKVFRT